MVCVFEDGVGEFGDFREVGMIICQHFLEKYNIYEIKMTQKDIELRIKELEKIKQDAQRKVEAKRDVKMSQMLVESCDEEIKNLREKQQNK